MVYNMDAITTVTATKLAVDKMYGRLARWLRIIGYDTFYEKDIDNIELVLVARRENRVFLTSNRSLARLAEKKGVKSVLIPTSMETTEILHFLYIKQVIDIQYPIEPIICPECNHVLQKRDINLWVCLHCGKKYWKGSHWKNIQNTLISIRNRRSTEGGESTIRSSGQITD